MKKILMSINKDLKETRVHGTYEFPMAIYFSVLSEYTMGFINWHWHEAVQFCHVVRGTIKFYVNGDEYLLNQGEGIFVNSRYLHMAKPADDPDSAYLCLDFSPRLLGSFQGSILETAFLDPFLYNNRFSAIKLRAEICEEQRILEHIRELYQVYKEHVYGYELQSMSILYSIWNNLVHIFESIDSTKHVKETGHNEMMRNLLDFIERSYKEPLTLEMIASHVSLSKSECCRQFRQFTGETIFSYIQSVRLTHAVSLLNDSDLSITDIAYRSGFCSSSYFIEIFRKNMGITPLQYRKLPLKKPAEFIYTDSD